MSAAAEKKDKESSDESDDEDYVPPTVEPDSDKEDAKYLCPSLKRKLEEEKKNNNKQIKGNEDGEDEIDEWNKAENKKKADDLWSSFLKDTKTKPKPTSASTDPVTTNLAAKQKEETSTATKNGSSPSLSGPTSSKSSEKNKIGEPKSPTKEVVPSFSNKYAAFSVDGGNETTDSVKSRTTSVEKPKPKMSGMAGLLGKLKEQPKISTLEKSRLDWNEFKKEENIEEDLTTHTRGKQSFLERAAFLNRADNRQFEIEKDLRAKERRLRESQQ
jgi:hypothetical protein